MFLNCTKALIVTGILMLTACSPGDNTYDENTNSNQVEVTAYYGVYNAKTKYMGEVSKNLEAPEPFTWDLDKEYRQKPNLRIGVLFPNKERNDPYWKLAREGIEQQVKQHNFELELISSESYRHLEQHQSQFIELAKSLPDAIIIGSIHYRAMDSLIHQARQGEFGKPIPVIGITNDLHAPSISGKVMVSFKDMGKQAANFVLEDAVQTQKDSIRIAFLPGPINSGWAPDSLSGFVNSIRNFPGDLDLIEPKWGTPTAEVQKQLLESVLEHHDDIDYIIGNAVAAAEATILLGLVGTLGDTKIVSTYYNPGLRDLIMSGHIAAAPFDQTDNLGRIAVTMAAEIISGKSAGKDIPFRVTPEIPVITSQNLSQLIPE